MDKAFMPDLRILRGEAIPTSLLNLDDTDHWDNKAHDRRHDLFGALIRRKFDSSSNQYREINLLSLSIPVIDAEQPHLLFPVIQNTEQPSIESKSDDSSTKSTDQVKNQNIRHQNDTVPLKSGLLRPYFSMTTNLQFHEVYYSSSIKTTPEADIIRYCLLALQGFESELFQIGSVMYRRVVVPGHSVSATGNNLSVFNTYFSIRKLLSYCIASYNTRMNSVFPALFEVVTELLLIIDCHLQRLSQEYRDDRSKGLGNLLADTRLHCMILWEIALVAFPSDLLKGFKESTKYSLSKNATMFKYLNVESWIEYHNNVDGWSVISEVISAIFKLHSSSTSTSCKDIFQTSQFFSNGNISQYVNSHIADSFLKLNISSLFLKKLAEPFLNDLSKCLFCFQTETLPPIGLTQSLSLKISCRSMFSILTSEDTIGGRDLVLAIVSAYQWSINRLKLLSASVTHNQRLKNLCGDIDAVLHFPLSKLRINELIQIANRAESRLHQVEALVYDLIRLWKNSNTSKRNSLPTLVTDATVTVTKSTVYQSTVKDNLPEITNVAEPDHQLSQKPLPRDTNDNDSYFSILPQPNISIFDERYQLAKSMIIAKYSELTRKVDLRLAAVRWRQYRLEVMSQRRKNLRALFESESNAWNKQASLKISRLDKLSEAQNKFEAADTNIHQDIAPVHTGMRMYGYGPGGKSSFRLSYDDDLPNTTSPFEPQINAELKPISLGQAETAQTNNANVSSQQADHSHHSDASSRSSVIELISSDDNSEVIVEVKKNEQSNNEWVILDSSKPTVSDSLIQADPINRQCIDDMHGNLVDMKSIHSGIRITQAPGGLSSFSLDADEVSLPLKTSVSVNQAPGGTSSINLNDINEDDDPHSAGPMSLQSIYSGVRVSQAPGGSSTLNLKDALEEDDPQTAGPMSLQSIYSGVRVSQAPGGSSTLNLKDVSEDDDPHSAGPMSLQSTYSGVRVSQAPGGSSTLNLKDALEDDDPHSAGPMSLQSIYSGVRVNQAPGGNSDFQLWYNDIVPEQTNDHAKGISHHESMKSVFSGVRVNQAPGGVSQLSLAHEDGQHYDTAQSLHAIDEVDIPFVADDITESEEDITDDDESSINSEVTVKKNSKQVSVSLTTDSLLSPADQIVPRIPVNRDAAIALALKLYNQKLRSNTWMNIYDLLHPDSESYLSHEEKVHELLSDLTNGILMLSRENGIILDDNETDRVISKAAMNLAKPIDLIFRSTTLTAISIQTQVIDVATVLMAIERCNILSTLDRIEDLFLISERSDCILFVAESMIQTYLSKTSVFLDKASSFPSIQINLDSQSSNVSSLTELPTMWGVDLVNRCFHYITKQLLPSQEAGNIIPINASFVKSSQADPIAVSIDSSSTEYLIAKAKLSTSPLRAVFYTNGIEALNITYDIGDNTSNDSLSRSAIQSIHSAVFSQSVLDKFSSASRRLLELGQLRSLLRTIFSDLRQRRLQGRRAAGQFTEASIDRKLYFAYEKVRADVQAICDFTGDRLRVARIVLKDTLSDSIARDGMAGLIDSVNQYSSNIAIETFSLHCGRSTLSPNDLSEFDIIPNPNISEQSSMYCLIRAVLGCCRFILRDIYICLSSPPPYSTYTAGVDGSLSVLATYRTALLHRATGEYHLRSKHKDAAEALLMYFGASPASMTS